MAGRKDGKRKSGSGKRIEREHFHTDLIDRRTVKPNLTEVRFNEVVFKAGSNPKRDFYQRGIEELLIATGWKSIQPRTIIAQPKETYDPIRNLFFVEFPFTYSRKGGRYAMHSCRLYPGRIETYKCRKAHRCALLDIAPENPYRNWPEKKVPLELLIEYPCKCFNEEKEDHEGVLFLYRWR